MRTLPSRSTDENTLVAEITSLSAPLPTAAMRFGCRRHLPIPTIGSCGKVPLSHENRGHPLRAETSATDSLRPCPRECDLGAMTQNKFWSCGHVSRCRPLSQLGRTSPHRGGSKAGLCQECARLLQRYLESARSTRICLDSAMKAAEAGATDDIGFLLADAELETALDNLHQAQQAYMWHRREQHS